MFKLLCAYVAKFMLKNYIIKLYKIIHLKKNKICTTTERKLASKQWRKGPKAV